jgi:hypothetical protein
MVEKQQIFIVEKLSNLKLVCYGQPSLKNSKNQGILSSSYHAALTEGIKVLLAHSKCFCTC